jgi:hypothetical protein
MLQVKKIIQTQVYTSPIMTCIPKGPTNFKHSKL